MKKIITYLAILFLIPTAVSSQSCLPQGYNFYTQMAVDNFSFNNPNCTEIEGDVTIGSMAPTSDITNLDSLIVLTRIGGDLIIMHNPYLTTLSGLDSISYIEGNLFIGMDWAGNSALTNLNGLSGLDSVGGSLLLNENPLLSNVLGLSNLSSIGGSLDINGSLNLVHLTGLENLTNIGGNLTIGKRIDSRKGRAVCGNPSLVNLGGLNNLSSIGGSFSMVCNDNLSSLAGLENLAYIGGDLEIGGIWGYRVPVCHENPRLKDFTGLDMLATIGGSLNIYCNDSLTSLAGLENLTTIGGSLHIGWQYDNRSISYGSESLNSLAALEALTFVGGQLCVIDNPSLTSLSGLDNIESTYLTDIYIYNNDSLSSCNIFSVCDYLSNPNGISEIHNNASGCESEEQVDSACAYVSVQEYSLMDDFTINPNPTPGIFTIHYSLFNIQKVVLDIYSITGVKVQEVLSEVQGPGEYDIPVNMGNLQPGIYFCVMKTVEGIVTKKVVKL